MDESGIRNVDDSWFKRNEDQMNETLSGLRKLSNIEDKQDHLISEVGRISDRVKSLEDNQIFNSKSDFDDHLEVKLKPLLDSHADVLNKMKEMEVNIKADVLDPVKRRKKLVVEGAPSHYTPIALVKKLVSTLDIQCMDNSQILRTHKWTSNPSAGHPKSMFNIEFKYEEDKYLFINKEVREKLENLDNSNEFYGVKIYHDRSPAERRQHQIASQEVSSNNQGLGPDSTYKWIVRDGRPTKVRIQKPNTNQQSS